MTTVGRCPRCGYLEHNRRRDAFAQGFEDGRARGFAEAAELRAEVGVPPELSDVWLDLVQLAHPDRHEGAQFERANRVTAALIAWRDRVEARGGR